MKNNVTKSRETGKENDEISHGVSEGKMEIEKGGRNTEKGVIE